MNAALQAAAKRTGGAWAAFTAAAKELMSAIADQQAALRLHAPANFTRRESEVYALICERTPGKQIADRLHISKRTVKSHISKILRKMGVAAQQELWYGKKRRT